MPSAGQIGGALLEEVVLHLLRVSGYRPVVAVGDDPTLRLRAAGMEVQGRGTWHQIDAIADFLVHPPFSNRQRLLVEAKLFHEGRKVSLPVVRNALGTLRDVSEAWTRSDVPRPRVPPRPRYHHQYSLFSATGYSRTAQDFAFAHDVFLIPLAHSAFFQPVLTAVRTAANEIHVQVGERRLATWRRQLRELLRPDGNVDFDNGAGPLEGVVAASARLSGALLATLGGEFPVFLVPAQGVQVDVL